MASSPVRPENFYQNVRRNKVILGELSGLISSEIQSRAPFNSSVSWDFRFMIIVAQWLVEQNKYTMTPTGNNPGNVQGYGDQGYFTLAKNQEVINGKRVLVPDAKFARYSSMEYATKVKFDLLKEKWPLAYQAVLQGDKVEKYGNGLFPGKPKNYATADWSSYVGGLRWRMINHVVPHYIAACEDDIKELKARDSQRGGKKGGQGQSLDSGNDPTMNQNTINVGVNMLSELKKLLTRIKTNKGIQAA
jgi:hypothetical protein